MILQPNFNKKEFFEEVVQEILKKSVTELITAKRVGGGTHPLASIQYIVADVRSYLEYLTLENLNELPDPRFNILLSELIPFVKLIDLILNRENDGEQLVDITREFSKINDTVLNKI